MESIKKKSKAKTTMILVPLSDVLWNRFLFHWLELLRLVSISFSLSPSLVHFHFHTPWPWNTQRNYTTLYKSVNKLFIALNSVRLALCAGGSFMKRTIRWVIYQKRQRFWFYSVNLQTMILRWIERDDAFGRRRREKLSLRKKKKRDKKLAVASVKKKRFSWVVFI